MRTRQLGSRSRVATRTATFWARHHHHGVAVRPSTREEAGLGRCAPSESLTRRGPRQLSSLRHLPTSRWHDPARLPTSPGGNRRMARARKLFYRKNPAVPSRNQRTRRRLSADAPILRRQRPNRPSYSQSPSSALEVPAYDHLQEPTRHLLGGPSSSRLGRPWCVRRTDHTSCVGQASQVHQPSGRWPDSARSTGRPCASRTECARTDGLRRARNVAGKQEARGPVALQSKLG